MKLGETIEVLCPEGDNFEQQINLMTDETKTTIDVAPHPQQTHLHGNGKTGVATGYAPAKGGRQWLMMVPSIFVFLPGT